MAIHGPQPKRRDRKERGIALLLVMFYALLLTATVATFLRRATIDAAIAHNRDRAAAASTLARGGIRLGTLMILSDQLEAAQDGYQLDSPADNWARISAKPIWEEGDERLMLRIQDASSKLNLNALLDEDGNATDVAHEFIERFLEKVIDEMPLPPEERAYDADELAWNLLDYMDPDLERSRWDGGSEDDFYQRQVPRERAANRPLLSVDELRVVEGFDPDLVDGMRPYVTIYPYTGGGGINPNTAEPHILALLFHQPYGPASAYELASVELVEQIMDYRDEQGALCEQAMGTCGSLNEFVTGDVFPPPSYSSEVFSITAEATVGDITRTIQTVFQRGNSSRPNILLSWKER